MLKRLSAFLTLCFFTVASANATPQTKTIKDILDDFHFGVTVEWDQQNKDFLNQKIQEMNSAVADLRQQGLTQDQLLSEVRQHIQDPAQQKALDSILELHGKGEMDQTQINEIIRKSLEHSYAQGASWRGRAEIAIASFIIAVAIIAILVATTSDGYSTGYYDCYYDFWGYYTCGYYYYY